MAGRVWVGGGRRDREYPRRIAGRMEGLGLWQLVRTRRWGLLDGLGARRSKPT